MNRYYKFLYKYAKPYRISFILMGIVSNLISFVNLFYPILLAYLVDYVYAKENIEYFPYIILMYILVFLLEQMLHMVEYRLWAYHYKKIMYDMKVSLFSKMINMKAKVLDEMNQGEYNILIHRDTENSYLLINWFINNYIMNIIRYVLHIVCLFYINRKLCLALFFAIPVLALLSVLIKKYIHKKSSENRGCETLYANCVFDFFHRLLELRLLHADENMAKKLSVYQKKIQEINCHKGMVNSIFSEGYELVNLGFLLAFFSLVNYLVSHNDLTIGQFLAAYTYFGSAIIGLKTLFDTKNIVNWLVISVKKIYNIINCKKEIEEDIEKINTLSYDLDGDLSFKNINFGYESDKKILDDITFTIKKNSKVAIIGSSGCGKTTLIKLMQKFYEPQAGCILIGNIDYSDISFKDIRKKFAVVQQDICLFDKSIRYNLLLAKKNATDNELNDVCRKVNILSYIQSLPQGFDTIIGPDGIEMSGGQKQRIAIARALLKEAKFIIFDEATSALDTKNEKNILKTINQLKDVTVIFITHRVYTVQDVDNIIVLKNSRVNGDGRHDKLIKTCDEYKILFYKSKMLEGEDEKGK